MDKQRRIVIVGMGSIGRRHAKLLKEHKDITVEMVEPEQDARTVAQEKLGKIYLHKSFEEMLKTKPEIVLIATPHRLHASQTIQALYAGCHVFCEKPMSDNLADAVKMNEVAKSTGLVLNIGFQLHFHPGLVMLRKIIKQGILGSVLHAHAKVGTYITLVNSISGYQASQEGALFYDYTHQSDILLWLLGKKPKAIYALALQGGNLEFSSNPNLAIINCEYDSSIFSTIHLNYVQMPERHEYEIIGDKGWAVLDANMGILRTGMRENSSMQTESFSIDRDDMYRGEHKAFFQAIDKKSLPESPAKDGLVSIAVCDAAMKSWKTKERIILDI
jgi:predicted dehydrogenase